MSRIYGDAIHVWTTADGVPVRFVWRSRSYTVGRVFERWIGVRNWWKAALGEETSPKREFYRVEATLDGSNEVRVYELRYDETTAVWLLWR